VVSKDHIYLVSLCHFQVDTKIVSILNRHQMAEHIVNRDD
jgi:hypothetical protein